MCRAQPIELPAEAKRWGRMAAKTARMLARIHQTPFSETDKRYLMDDDVEVAWFLKGGQRARLYARRRRTARSSGIC